MMNLIMNRHARLRLAERLGDVLQDLEITGKVTIKDRTAVREEIAAAVEDSLVQSHMDEEVGSLVVHTPRPAEPVVQLPLGTFQRRF